MVEKVKEHVNVLEVEKLAQGIRIAGLPQSEDDEDENLIDIPDVPLQIDNE